MIPDSVTQADLERWNEGLEAAQADYAKPSQLLSQLMPGFTTPTAEEIHMSGCWLGEQLELEGVSEDEIEPVIFANGQKVMFAHMEQKDAWDVANETLEAFRSGNWDRPGSVLAEQLNDKFLKIAMNNSQRRN